MNTNFLRNLALALTVGAFTLRAPAQTQTVLTNTIIEVQVTDGQVGSVLVNTPGSGYTAPPTISFTIDGGGSGAVAVPVMSADGSSVIGVNVTNGGSGYSGVPTVVFSGGWNGNAATALPTQATGTAYLGVIQSFDQPYQNDGYGPAGVTVGILSLAEGLDPVGGFSYSFTANGTFIGTTDMNALAGTPAGIYFTPALPGYYDFVSTTSANGSTAVSAPIRYFATGTAIISPEAGGQPFGGPGTLIPAGSSVVMQAISTPQDGFVSRIDFYTDWTGSTATSVLIGSNTSNIIYTPAGGNGTQHLVKALAYDNNGTLIPSTNNLDEVTITVTTASPDGLPTVSIVSPYNGQGVQLPATGSGGGVQVVVSAAPPKVGGVTITKVELYVNGALIATDTEGPYNFTWNPVSTGIYNLAALVYDSVGNVIASTSGTSGSGQTPQPTVVTVQGPPAVAIVSPGNNATVNSGAPTSVTAVVADVNTNAQGVAATITSVQFFQDGVFVGSASSPTTGTNDYTITFKPTQKTVNGEVVPSAITAEATDSLGYTATSPAVTVNVTSGGSGSNVVIGTPPTISLTTPTSGQTVTVNTPVTFSATATAPNGNVAEVDFLVDGAVVSSETSYPYSTTYTFNNLGTYTVGAQVIDNLGDKTVTPSITVTVGGQALPTVSLTSPNTGSTVTTGQPVTLTANAASPNGTIASVAFYENGILIGTSTTPPYEVTFTPQSAGIYTLTEIATDNAGQTTTSASTVVEAVSASAGVGTIEYYGQYQGLSLTNSGNFAFMVVDGKYGVFIAHAASGTAGNVLQTDLPVSTAGTFTGTNLSGSANTAGVSGSYGTGNALFIGAASNGGGYYTGSLSGQPNSNVAAILGGNGSLMLYVTNGTTADVADGAVDSSGNFSITTQDGNTATGTINPTTGFLSGTLSGPAGGTIQGALTSNGTFSDGVLRNLSTRGDVGTGANVMVAGFVVGGTATKHLLVRAVGPGLQTYGLSGTLSAPQLQVFSGTTLFASDTGWNDTTANANAVAVADAQVGAFTLSTANADSALVATFPPGAYTAQISGVGGATGVALAEVYDLDNDAPFTANRLTNVSTRGQVGTGSDVMIGGFAFNGEAPKRLLIRGAGPSLAAMNVTDALTAAHIVLDDVNGNTIRENYDWQTGNDSGLLEAAETATGAFSFATGSADAAMLVTLPPGTYTVILSGATTGSTGVGLIEVYEVP